MERVLVTGAGGYVGTTLVPMLLSEGYAVRALDRYFFGGDLLPRHEDLEIVKEDNRRVSEEHLNKIDYVIDLAALSNDPSGELFQKATWEINHAARTRVATLAKKKKIKRYVMPSSCSVYGFQEPGVIADEASPANPLTTYARANLKAEQDILPLADEKFTAVAVRQATVYGYSPRMRFDLAINGMTVGAWKTGKLPVMRDGSQWRPMVHVKDAANAICLMLRTDPDKINGQVFNVGSDHNNYQLKPLAEEVAASMPKDVELSWYGDPDHRSYRVSFKKIEVLGFKATRTARDGVHEICDALTSGRLDQTAQTLTLQWYMELVKWHRIIKEVELHGGIIDL